MQSKEVSGNVEASAAMFGAQLTPGCKVHVGPVTKRKGAAFFEVTVPGQKAVASLVVTVAKDARPSDAWAAWALALEFFGFAVSCDPAYHARVLAVGGREAAAIRKGARAYQQRARLARRLAAA